jgi:putative flippase GtrA
VVPDEQQLKRRHNHDRNRHPERGLVNAFLIFVGVFGGIVLLAIAVVAVVLDQYLPDDSAIPRAIAPILAIAVVIPAWQLAMRMIRRPPAPKNEE